MKKIVLFTFLCLSYVALFGQAAANNNEAIKLQNAGNDAIKAKDYAKALDNYEKAMAVWGNQPQDFVMVYNCGICAIQTSNLDKALKYFDLAYKNNYKPEDALNFKAKILNAQKKKDEYLAALNEGITKFPESAKFKDALANNSFAEGVGFVNSANAIIKAAIDKVNTKKFKDDKDPAYKAEMEKAKKELTSGVASLDKALSFNPTDPTKIKALKEQIEKQLKTL